MLKLQLKSLHVQTLLTRQQFFNIDTFNMHSTIQQSIARVYMAFGRTQDLLSASTEVSPFCTWHALRVADAT